MHVLRKLVAILPPSDSAGPDVRAGLADGKIYLSVYSMMYRLLCNFQMDDINIDWKQIWRVLRPSHPMSPVVKLVREDREIIGRIRGLKLISGFEHVM
ncbi:hypothetical protein A2U01_0014550 [Trifolium medium]|uniref:Uncharacterized protein n=1 Tax=Trifolium medium TaxID=97028 RepID=A0A392N3Q0_9FABA|nr:hypothetical protein [Trifolium medium]